MEVAARTGEVKGNGCRLAVRIGDSQSGIYGTIDFRIDASSSYQSHRRNTGFSHKNVILAECENCEAGWRRTADRLNASEAGNSLSGTTGCRKTSGEDTCAERFATRISNVDRKLQRRSDLIDCNFAICRYDSADRGIDGDMDC